MPLTCGSIRNSKGYGMTPRGAPSRGLLLATLGFFYVFLALVSLSMASRYARRPGVEARGAACPAAAAMGKPA